MRKIDACLAAAALGALTLSTPAAAFGLRIGPFHIGIPFYWHRGHHHPLYMHAAPSDVTRHNEAAAPPGEPPSQPASVSATPALLYPATALPPIVENIFWPAYSSAWPLGYDDIFSTAFARTPTDPAPQACQTAVDPDAIVAKIQAEVSPNPDQMQRLQKLGGAMGAASGYLQQSCPKEIPAQPIARLQLMESQVEELAMALDIIRQPLQDFDQSLDANQHAAFAGKPVMPDASARHAGNATGGLSCGGSPAVLDRSIDRISQSVQATDAQRGALDEVRQAFSRATSDLEAHCPTAVPSSAIGRLETVEARLDATWRAVLSIQVALGNFQSKLSDDQKGRFDTMNLAAQ